MKRIRWGSRSRWRERAWVFLPRSRRGTSGRVRWPHKPLPGKRRPQRRLSLEATTRRRSRQLLDAFIKAFNAGNAEAAAATYSDTAVVVDEAGERLEGRAAIRSKYAASFADNPGSTITIKVDALRFIGPETALEVGKATITPAAGAGAPETTRFTTVYVKQGGQWLQGAVRDELVNDLAPHERLKELEWLVGEWVNESQDAVVDTPRARGPKGATFWTASSP